jgi:hypothetical protein
MADTVQEEEVRRALDRFADLILFEQGFMQKFTDDARGVRDEYGLGAIPEEVMDAVADISMDEVRVLAQIHQRREPVELTDHVCIFF